MARVMFNVFSAYSELTGFVTVNIITMLTSLKYVCGIFLYFRYMFYVYLYYRRFNAEFNKLIKQ